MAMRGMDIRGMDIRGMSASLIGSYFAPYPPLENKHHDHLREPYGAGVTTLIMMHHRFVKLNIRNAQNSQNMRNCFKFAAFFQEKTRLSCIY